MKDWQEIVRLYERDSVYLGEAAQILVRNINYDLPSVKKQITKFDQLVDEAQKKIHDLTASETILLSQRTALCQKLGIDGKDLAAEFTFRVKELPKLYDEIVNATKKLNQALNLYSSSTKNEECLPLVRYVLAKGNTTVYEFVNGEAPLSVEEPPVEIKLSQSDVNAANAESNEIDFGDEDAGEIDFGDDIDIGEENEVQLEAGEIDWGDDEGAANAQQIDFDISLEDSGIKVESSGFAGGVARNEEALSLLDSPSHRDQFLDELFELESFLKMRVFELNSLENSNSSTFLIIDGLDNHTADDISTILVDVQQVIEKATTELIQHLHQLKHSEKYADILADKIQQKLVAVEKSQATRKVLKEKIETFKKDKLTILPLVPKLTEQTKILQVEVSLDTRLFSHQTEEILFAILGFFRLNETSRRDTKIVR